jgi:hypothetical protein
LPNQHKPNIASRVEIFKNDVYKYDVPRHKLNQDFRKSSSLKMDDFDTCDLTVIKPLVTVLDVEENGDEDEDDFELINPDEYHVLN